MGLFRSAYSALYKGIVSALQALGLPVNTTADLPRVEIHSFTEGAPMDKGGSVRQLTVVVEAMSARSVADAVAMAQTSLEGMLEEDLDLGDDFEIIGIVPVQLQDITETSDTQEIVYRVLQTFNVFIQNA